MALPAAQRQRASKQMPDPAARARQEAAQRPQLPPAPIYVVPISVSVEDACAATSLSASTLYNLMNAGALEWRLSGRRRLILWDSLDRYVRSLPGA